jgi:hypothetical protein
VYDIDSLVAAAVLASAIWPLACFCRMAWRTALRSTCFWTLFAWLAWSVTVVFSGLDREPSERISLGLLRLAATALLLAPLVAVLGARRPGELAWNLIVLTLLVVFAQPVLEQWLLGKQLERGRVGMDGPRWVFFCLVAAVGIVNYLPTRYGAAAALFAAGLAAQLAAVGPWSIAATHAMNLSSLAAVLLGVSAWTAWSLRPRKHSPGIDGAWLRLRDGWGLVWASRVRDRWNAAASRYDWPVRLGRRGLESVATSRGEKRPLSESETAAAESQLRLLLRRFVDDTPKPDAAASESAPRELGVG